MTLLAAHFACAGVVVDRLRCEHLVDPIGIAAERPRLGWIVRSEEPDCRQSAYQILVATRRDRLAADTADLWDSGKVESAETIDLPYQGAPIAPHARCWWTVRVWDENGKVSAWSKPATWTVGPQGADDWAGEWIGYDAMRDRTDSELHFEEVQWIAHAADDPMSTPAGNRLYVLRFDLPSDVEVREATALVAADDKHWLAVNGKIVVHEEPGWQRVKPVAIGETLQTGANELRVNVANDELGPSALAAKISILLANGKTVTLRSDKRWETFATPGQHWPSEALPQDGLAPCAAVGEYGRDPWGTGKKQELFLPPVPRLRGKFRIERPIASAVLYATALGLCDAYLNGELVSEERFTPGWTDYNQRVYCRAYDVTDRLREGDNAWGAELADGWYSGYVGWGQNRDHYGKDPRVRMMLHVDYSDGTSEDFATNGEWLAADGPTRQADFLMGETYDARSSGRAWSAPGFDDSGWAAVDVDASVEASLEPHPGPPVVVVGEFKPVAITEPRPGQYVVNLGQNFAGVPQLRVRGEPGQRVTLRFAERLNEDGTLYTVNLRGARATDTLICSGGEDVWAPRFTFHGFQYVEITGLDSSPDRSTIKGLALSSDTPRSGRFECSDPMLNRLVENIYWTQRSNFIDVPTDCPQRDERLGWTGDAQVYVSSACLNADVQAFFTKWLTDLCDAQRADGQFPMVAPQIIAGDDGGPAWADAGVICPWRIYEAYGDKQLLERCYPSMRRFVEFCRQRSVDGVSPPEEFHCFGDWLSVNADTPKDLIYQAYYAHSTRLLARAAKVLGKADEATRYEELADRIAEDFRRRRVQDDGRIEGDTQCGYVLALAYDLLNDEQRALAADRLVADIEARGDHLSTGFIGTKNLMLTLAKVGRNDVAYRLVHQKSYPSWGFSIAHGATSIWERWDGWTPERGFQDPGMNSFAHYSFGAVYQWMVENVGGIRNGGDAYRRIEIAPTIDDGLDWADVGYDNVRGPIASSWRKTPSGLRLEVELPANTSGEVRLPISDISRVTRNGQPMDLSATRVDRGGVVANVPSGRHVFLLTNWTEDAKDAAE